MHLVVYIFAIVLAFASSQKFIELTHPFANDLTISWPTSTKFNLKIRLRGRRPTDGMYYEANDFSQAEHSGTHTDAPAHFHEGSWRIGDIPIDRLVGPGVVIDIQKRARQDPDTMLRIEDLKAWESKFGRIPEGAVVIMRSGFGKKYGNRTAYFGWPPGTEKNNPNDTENLHFPGFDLEAAQWLGEEREIIGVAVDTASTDRGQSHDFKTHQILGKFNIWGLENLANAEALPLHGFTIYNMVDYLRDGSGAPSRVFAVLDKINNGVDHLFITTYVILSAIVFLVLMQHNGHI